MSALDNTDLVPDIPPGLTAEVIEVLALLEDAPKGMAEAAIALLPFGSRASLAAHGLIERMRGGPEDAVMIEITPQGWHVIHACGEARRAHSGRAGGAPPMRRQAVNEFLAALQRQFPTVNLGGLSARLGRDD